MTISKRSFLIHISLLGSLWSFGQGFSDNDYQFLLHLESISAYDEGVFWLEQKELVLGRTDTTAFHLGMFEYFRKNRASSIRFFEDVTRSNLNFWNISRFYSGLQYAYLGDYAKANQVLMQTDSLSELHAELRKLSLAGLSLLDHNFERFESFQTSFDPNYYQLVDHQQALLDTYHVMRDRKAKSPVIAGVLSAIIPGGGKFYLGKIGQGTMSLMTSTIFALQAYEGYRKDGPKSASFIVFGSIFSIFYVANIWGSVVAVKVENVNFNKTNHDAILLHMHIPIRLLCK